MATCYSRRVSARNRRGGIRTNPRTNEWVQMGTKKAKRNLLLSSSRGKKCARVHSVQFQKGKGENEFRQEALRPSALLSFDSNKRPLRWLINGLTEREVGTIAFPLNLGQCPNAPSDESTNSCSPVFLSFPFFSSLFFSFFFLSFFPSSQTSRMVENWFSLIELSSSLSWFFRRWWIHYSVKKEENEQKSGTPPWRWKVSRGTGDRDTAKSVYRAAVCWMGILGHAFASSWQGFTTGAGIFDAWKARNTKCALACTRHSCARAVLCSANVER